MAKSVELFTCGESDQLDELLSAYRLEVAVELRAERRPLKRVPVVSIAGLRPSGPKTEESLNQVWQAGPLRDFADHMQSEAFAGALAQLLKLAGSKRIVLLDGPGAWFRSTRGLLADRLYSAGHRVWHLHSLSEKQPHTLTPGAQLSLQNRGNYALVVLGLERSLG